MNERWYYQCLICGNYVSRTTEFRHQLEHKEKNIKKYMKKEVKLNVKKKSKKIT
jgi:hypothetical protein